MTDQTPRVYAAMRTLEQAGAAWANAAADAVRELKEGDYEPESEAYNVFVLAIRDLAIGVIEHGDWQRLREEIEDWPAQYIGSQWKREDKAALAGARPKDTA